ncbi:MAG: creatininase family protein [Caldisphaeraceae archaeon]|nr:creatininase family protein [Caldisphaeraceae archaeon]MEB3691619.1 creatininase family protein [Caldisphaeraceae archaeon]MEB3798008.1 creatininase family protein [Caldisphaeraceae archaeon]
MKEGCVEYRYISSGGLKNYLNNLFVLPIGSIEQHCGGPLGLDAIIAENISKGLCRFIKDIVILPTIYYAFSPEWSNVPGTISLNILSFSEMIKSILTSLYKSGIRRVLIINSHGGNSGLLEAIVREWINNYDKAIVILLDYWKVLNMEIGHAGKTEESLSKLIGISSIGNCKGIVKISKVRSKVIVKGPSIPSKTEENVALEVSFEEIINIIANEINDALKIAENRGTYFLL